jgi:hypothetical protein
MNKYIIIDVMEHNVYYFYDDIEMGFSLDSITSERDRLEIPYVVRYYNNGRVLSIRAI